MKASVLAVTLFIACSPSGTGRAPAPAMGAAVALEANVPLPAGWQDQRPEFIAAIAEGHHDRVSMYLQVNPGCTTGIHAHLRQAGDSIRMVAHYGLEKEEQWVSDCFSTCDHYCPTLYRYVLPTPQGRYLVEVFLEDSLITSSAVSVGP